MECYTGPLCLEVSREWSLSSAFSQRGLDDAHVDAVSNQGQKSRRYNKNSEKYALLVVCEVLLSVCLAGWLCIVLIGGNWW